MGYNYAKEKRKFDKEWERLRLEYKAAGMPEQVIRALYDYDCQWFRSRRIYMNHNQELPEETIPRDSENRSGLRHKFETMNSSFDESMFSGRFAWVETIEHSELVDKLKQLKAEDLELLTLLVIDGYSQTEIARMRGCSKTAINKKIIRIKKSLK